MTENVAPSTGDKAQETAPGRTRFPCSGCGADVAWDPSKGALRCPYCGTVSDALSALAPGLAEHPLDLAADSSGLASTVLAEGAREVSCTGCGTTVSFLPPEVAGDCPFCGARIVAQAVDAHPLLAPDGVLPFTVDQSSAKASIRRWIHSRWFAPNALKKMARDAGIRGVYLPFWTYDARTETDYVGERGEHYWDEETYTTTDSEGRTVRRTRSVRRTRWYPAAGSVSHDFDDVLVPAARSVSTDRLDALAPWDLGSAVPFRPEFLSGFQAQRYEVDPLAGSEEAKSRMARVIDVLIRQDIGGDEQRVHHREIRFSDETFKHLLLPVWMAAYRFNQRVFQVMVNARTGEVIGERPWSAWKIGFAVVAALVLAAFVWWRANQS